MRLAENISRFGSIAVVGMAKNVGKTVTLNHLLDGAHKDNIKTGVTSIGVDGESIDRVTSTRKPEIRIHEGMIFATSETHYRSRCLEAEIINLDYRRSALGRTVTARALSTGKTLLSGPGDTTGMARLIREMHAFGARTVLVDGALSRLSPASPTVTDALVLATGAAISPEIKKIVAGTVYICKLVNIPEVDQTLRNNLAGLIKGVWGIDSCGEPHNLEIQSALELERLKENAFRYGTTLYISGMVGDRLINFLATQPEIKNIQLIVRDFTRLFVEQQTLKTYLKKGGKIRVIKKSELLGVTVNPWSPAGYTVDKVKLKEELASKISVPVYNVWDE